MVNTKWTTLHATLLPASTMYSCPKKPNFLACLLAPGTCVTSKRRTRKQKETLPSGRHGRFDNGNDWCIADGCIINHLDTGVVSPKVDG